MVYELKSTIYADTVQKYFKYIVFFIYAKKYRVCLQQTEKMNQ